MGSAASVRVPKSAAGAISEAALLTRWQTRHLESELFGVVRHAERADDIFAFHNGQRWTGSKDGRTWPLDPPLSDSGHDQAQVLATDIQNFAAQRGSEFHVVISSPYLRCVQTAAHICKQLGPNVRLLVDQSLAEVHGPEVMGAEKPRAPIRTAAVGREFCRSLGVCCVSRPIGQAPEWPETLQGARQRFALRFLSHLRRAAKGRRNFLLVTHADCVGSVLKIIPSTSDRLVQRVDPGAAVLASRSSRLDQKPTSKFATVVPSSMEEPDGEMMEWNSESVELTENSRPGWTEQEGWQCQTLNLTMGQEKTSASKLARRFASLAESGVLSAHKIQKLLGEMERSPLTMASMSPRTSTVSSRGFPGAAGSSIASSTSSSSHVSFSTMMFAASELNLSCGDDRSPLRCQSNPWFHAGNVASPVVVPASSVSDNNYRSRRSRDPHVSANRILYLSRIHTGDMSASSQAAQEAPGNDAIGGSPDTGAGRTLSTAPNLPSVSASSASDANSQRAYTEGETVPHPKAAASRSLAPLSQVETSSILQRRHNRTNRPRSDYSTS
eukprot:TRINITY_DN27933_c0_g1_i1.p1 TRINITY_DN27933_c0_g1~~TRINITY_DN27933_c0_g1_i1.p1  ORF type:complete len:555 (-),score=74.72 TRINITY_DN27933_c0_g1_i1:236-1900(-)